MLLFLLRNESAAQLSSPLVLTDTYFYSVAMHVFPGNRERSGSVVECLTRGIEPHRRHCVVSLSKTHKPKLSTGSTQEDPSLHNWKIVDGT